MTTDGRVLRTFAPIDDPGPEKQLVIAPGQVLSGTSPLCCVEGFAERRKHSDIIVLWSYRLVLEGEEPETDGVSSGVLVFGRTAD